MRAQTLSAKQPTSKQRGGEILVKMSYFSYLGYVYKRLGPSSSLAEEGSASSTFNSYFVI